jgi:hypothetical protein
MTSLTARVSGGAGRARRNELNPTRVVGASDTRCIAVGSGRWLAAAGAASLLMIGPVTGGGGVEERDDGARDVRRTSGRRLLHHV